MLILQFEVDCDYTVQRDWNSLVTMLTNRLGQAVTSSVQLLERLELEQAQCVAAAVGFHCPVVGRHQRRHRRAGETISVMSPVQGFSSSPTFIVLPPGAISHPYDSAKRSSTKVVSILPQIEYDLVKLK